MLQLSSAVIEQVFAQRLTLLAACWRELFSSKKNTKKLTLHTVQQQSLVILDAGSLTSNNNHTCFLFHNTSIKLGKNQLQGQIQLSWQPLPLPSPPPEPPVILQVVYQGSSPSSTLPLLSLKPYLHDRLCWAEELVSASKFQHMFPGPCGLAAAQNPQKLTDLLQHAAEARVRIKSDTLMQPLKQQLTSPHSEQAWKILEQALFEAVCRFIGFKPYQDSFTALAKHFPLSTIIPLLQLPISQARMQILARWMGTLHLLQQPPSLVHQDCRSYYTELQQLWISLKLQPLPKPLQRAKARPFNSPERRLTALFWHLHHMTPHGLLHGWLRFLSRLDNLRDDDSLQTQIKHFLRGAFHTPNHETWQFHTTFHAKTLSAPIQLVGEHLLAVLAANAIVPFLLGIAHWKQDEEMEKTLYRFYLLLPTEISNQRIQFMQYRLFLSHHQNRPLRLQQGLLQLQNDFCHHFPNNCHLCQLPAKLL